MIQEEEAGSEGFACPALGRRPLALGFPSPPLPFPPVRSNTNQVFSLRKPGKVFKVSILSSLPPAFSLQTRPFVFRNRKLA